MAFKLKNKNKIKTIAQIKKNINSKHENKRKKREKGSLCISSVNSIKTLKNKKEEQIEIFKKNSTISSVKN